MIKKFVVLILLATSFSFAQKVGSEATKKILLIKPNGITEQYATIESALAATDTNGSEIRVGVGVYDIDGTAGYHPLYMRPNTTLIGVPGQTIIRRVSSETDLAPLIRVYPQLDTVVSQNKRNYKIYGIKFVGSNNGIYSGRVAGGSPTAEAGISLTPAKGVLNTVIVEQCEVRGTQREAIQVWDAEYVLINNNRSIANNYHAYNTSDIKTLIFTNNFADSCYLGNELDGYLRNRPTGSDTISHTLVANNVFTNSLGYGLQINGNTGDMVIENNIFSAAKDSFARGFLESYGVLIKQTVGASYKREMGNIIIRNNVLRGHTSGIALRGADQYDAPIRKLTIEGNTIDSTREQALAISATDSTSITHVTIRNNIITNWNRTQTAGSPDVAGIVVNKVDSVLIENNSIWSCRTSRFTDPLYITNTSGTIVRNNDFRAGASRVVWIGSNVTDSYVYKNLGITGTFTTPYSTVVPQVDNVDTLNAQAINLPSTGRGLWANGVKVITPDRNVFPDSTYWRVARGNGNYISNILTHVSVTGSDVIRNGGFSGSTSWDTTGSQNSWTFSGGNATITNSTQNAGITQYFSSDHLTVLNANSLYRFRITISNCDSVYILVGVNVNNGAPASRIYDGWWRAGTDSIDFVNTSGSSNSITFLFGNNSTATIDDVSLRSISGGNTGDVVTWDGTNWTNRDSINIKSIRIGNGSKIDSMKVVTGAMVVYSGGTAYRTDDGPAGSGISTLNTLTTSSQTLATGTSGSDFAISSASSTHTFNLPTASASNRGALSTTDWSTFNSKLDGARRASFVKSGSSAFNDSIRFIQGTNITLTQSGNTITIASASGSGTDTITAVTNPITRSTSGNTVTIGLDTSKAGGKAATYSDVILKANAASPTFTGTVTTPLGAGTVRSSSGGVLSSTASDTVGLGTSLAGKEPTLTKGDGIHGTTTIDITPKATGGLTITADSILVDSTKFPATDYDVSLKANISSPSFTGTVTLPTGLTGTLRASSGVVSATASDTVGLGTAQALNVKKATPIILYSGVFLDSLDVNTSVKTDLGLYFSQGVVIDTIVTRVTGGSSPSVTLKLMWGLDISATGTALITSPSATTSTTTVTKVSSFNNATIPAGNAMWATFSAVSGFLDATRTTFSVTVIGHY